MQLPVSGTSSRRRRAVAALPDMPRVPGLTMLRPVAGDAPPWRARDTTTGHDVVVRPMPPRGDPSRLAGLPDHPHLLVPRVVPDDTGRELLVARTASHGGLDHLLARRGRLTPPEISAVALAVGRALAALHAAGRVHGAVRADHVLLGIEARPLLDASPLAAAPSPHRETQPAPEDDVRDLGRLLVDAADDGLPMEVRVVLSAACDPDPLLRPSAVELMREVVAAVPPEPVRLTGDRLGGDSVPAGSRRSHVAGPRRGARAVPGVALKVAAVVGVAAALALAVVVGVGWARASDGAASGSRTQTLHSYAVLSASASAPTSPSAPASDWAATVTALDHARALAFAGADEVALGGVDAPGSAAAAADVDAVRQLAAAGVQARGYDEAVLSVQPIEVRPERAFVAVRDQRSAYSLVDPSGRVVDRRPARGPSLWQVELVRVGGAWRVADVQPAS